MSDSFNASGKRLAAIVAVFFAIAILVCLPASSPGKIVTAAVVAGSLLTFIAMFVFRRPVLQIGPNSLRFSSAWGEKSVAWNEIRAATRGGWGPMRYVRLTTTDGRLIIIPEWFEPSSDDIAAIINTRRAEAHEAAKL